MRRLARLLICVAVSAASAARAAYAGDPQLIPLPKSMKLGNGSMVLSEKSRIVTTDNSLQPLAAVLAGEIYLASGLKLATATDQSNPGDIVLSKSAELRGEAYRLQVTDRATVSGGTYVADAWGTATLLQALMVDNNQTTLPNMSIDDEPDMPYRGFMKDVARQYVPIETLYSAVELCRLYKVRYLHLHLSDDHAWVFPSTAYPKLGDRNEGAHSGPAPKRYDLAALKNLVNFADERGVTIVPEIEGPGHSGAMRISMPDLFDSPDKPGGNAHLGIMNMASAEMYAAMDTIIGEVADVFKSSPYIQIGCDEVGADAVKRARGYNEFIAEHHLKGTGDLFSYYVTQIINLTKKRGKIPIAWEGVPLEKQTPDDLILMMWTQYCGPQAKEYAAKGYRLINAQNGGYSGPREAMQDLSQIGVPKLNYTTDLYSFGLAHLVNIGDGNPKVIGAQNNDWESTWDFSAPIARRAVPAREANAWNAKESRDYTAFAASLEHTDLLVERLMEPIQVKNETHDDFDPSKAIQLLRKHLPFVNPVTVTLTSDVPSTQIHFTLDDTPPTAISPQYQSPLQVDKTAILCAAIFNAEGKQLAPEQRMLYDKINYEKSLTTGKPVTASATDGKASADYVTDGFAMKDIWRGWWDGGPCPQWVKIDLQEIKTINRIVVVPYWDGSRHYQYLVEVSTDGNAWTKIVDMSKNTVVATPEGHESKFDAIEARYIRVTILKNSANPGAHLVEVRAFGP